MSNMLMNFKPPPIFQRVYFPKAGPSRSIHPIQTLRIGASVLLGWNEKRDVCEQKAILCLWRDVGWATDNPLR